MKIDYNNHALSNMMILIRLLYQIKYDDVQGWRHNQPTAQLPTNRQQPLCNSLWQVNSTGDDEADNDDDGDGDGDGDGERLFPDDP